MIQEFAQRSMYALLEILFFFLHGARSLAAARAFHKSFFYFFFFFFLATADESPTIQLYSLNVDRPPSCPIKEPACSIKEPLRPDETVLVAKALSLVLCGRWGSRRNRRFSLPKSIIGLVPVLGTFFIIF